MEHIVLVHYRDTTIVSVIDVTKIGSLDECHSPVIYVGTLRLDYVFIHYSLNMVAY